MTRAIRRLSVPCPGAINTAELSVIDVKPGALSAVLSSLETPYVGLVDDGVHVDPSWFRQLTDTLTTSPELGAAAGTLIARDGTVLSSGIMIAPDLRWYNLLGGAHESDSVRVVDALPLTAAVFRRECLQQIGDIDPDFVAEGQAIDFAYRCRVAGWKLAYLPGAVARTMADGADPSVSGYFRERNRLLFAAKHLPDRLPEAVRTTTLSDRELSGCLPLVLMRLLRDHERPTAANALTGLLNALVSIDQMRLYDAVLKRLQVVLGHRRMSIGIYDHALHVVGGGQKYVATLASALQDQFDITYLVHHKVDVAQLRDWYDLDLSRCKIRVVPVPFYRSQPWVDSAMITGEMDNPFDAVARASADYDVFVNANMLEKVRPLTLLSLFACHFPDVLPRAHFSAHEYTLLVANSRYTSGWLRRRWGLAPSILLYPPIDAAGPDLPKERIILSVARFEPGGSKKQLEMVEAFRALRTAVTKTLRGWRLVLVGGSLERNAYEERVRDAIGRDSECIDLRVNVPVEELRTWYARASIFWHACGVGERDPQLIEHFGMTIVEAMQNRCAPVVFDGGGQREIVEHGANGFRFRTLDEMCAWTAHLIADEPLRESIQQRAAQSSKRFSRTTFEARVRLLFEVLEREYSTLARPDFAEVDRAFGVQSPSNQPDEGSRARSK